MDNVNGVVVFGPLVDDLTLQQATNCLVDSRARYVGLMADHHRGYSQPIGGVVAYENAVSPSGVGYDIGCGNNAVLTNVKGADLGVSLLRDFWGPGEHLIENQGEHLDRIMDEVVHRIKFGVGMSAGLGRGAALFEDARWKVNSFVHNLLPMAEEQLGSVGGGNHYVDILLDEADRVWIANHFGSRGFGHKTASGFLNLAKGLDWNARPTGEDQMALPTIIGLDTAAGQDYWTAMELAGDYAKTGRRLVLQTVLKIMGAHGLEYVENNHNLAWQEVHNGESLVVVRKGATPAFPGQRGFVGGSMGDDAVIVEGVESIEAAAALYSTVHGAGRVLGRAQAKGKYRPIKDANGKLARGVDGALQYECVRAPLVTGDMMRTWVERRGVVLRGGDVDEAPQAYKRLDEVLTAHTGAINVVHRLRPIAVAMAGKGDRDPYSD